MEIAFHFQQQATLKNRRKLRAFLVFMFKEEQKAAQSLNIIFCEDEYLLGINRSFLSHDFYTDIVTFNLADKQHDIAGELYISVERVKDNASNLNISFEKELHRVIFHGILHLCGYKDKTNKDIVSMRAAEDRYLLSYFSSNPFH